MDQSAPAQNGKWTEIEHLPAWDEDFYDVYTAKKYGKWVMLKTLKRDFKDNPQFQALIEKEFDVRYNLAHPNIVMINDFEYIPELGWCIITDDVYGESLRSILNSGKVTRHHLDQVLYQLVDAIDYIQTNHLVHFPIRPETIIFTDKVGNLKLIDVGFDQREHLTPTDTAEDIRNFGKVLTEVLDHVPDAPTYLRRIADRCADKGNPYHSIQSLKMAIARRSDNKVLIAIIAFLALVVALLVWLSLNNTSIAHTY